MSNRISLHALLVIVLGTDNVYYQPPPTIEMSYPCIVYSKVAEDTAFANDSLYNSRTRYQITFIGKDPDSPVPQRLATLKFSKFDRHYVTDGLNHDVYSVYI